MGLFAHYKADPGAIYAAADDLDARVKTLGSTRGSLQFQHAQAVSGTGGVLTGPATAALVPVINALQSVMQSSTFAAGCARYWGDAVTAYNTGVDGLNTRYDDAAAAHFGQTAPSFWDYLVHGKMDGYDDHVTAYQGAVATARDALIAQLKREEQTLHGTLDDAAAKAAGWLRAGPTQDSVVALTREGMMPLTVVDLFPGVDFSGIDFAALQRRLTATGRSGFLDPDQFPSSAAARRMLDLLREDGLNPSDYGELLQRYYLLVACEKAGIYLDGWDPSQGADANLHNILASYTYYGDLFLNNPNFQWCGMAAMNGPTFAGGMFDLQMLRRLSDLVSTPLDVAPDWLVDPLLPPALRDLAILGQMSEGEFRFFENSLLQMQKDIFADQMPQHEAYIAEGMTGIKEMYDAGLMDSDTYQAWVDIDSGDASRVTDGNEALLYREQSDIIGQSYDDMRNYHGPVGQAMTYAMGAIGAPSIPGAHTLAQYDPLEFSGRVEAPGVDIPGWDAPGPVNLPGIHTPRPYGELDVTTPFPDGNISNFDTRWDLISHDTLPAYNDLLANHPQEVRDILNTPVQDRIDDARIANNIDDIIARLSDWDVSVEIGVD